MGGWNSYPPALPELDLPTSDVRVLDYDLDGRMDLLLVPSRPDETFAQRAPKLYRNIGLDPLQYQDVSDVVGLTNSASDVNGVSVADYDNNGSLDIYLGRSTLAAPPQQGFYYLADVVSGGSTWVGVRLAAGVDSQINGSCIGAQVLIRDPSIVDPLNNIISGAQSYGGGAGRGGDKSRALRYGLGSVPPASITVEVVWPNGYTQQEIYSESSGDYNQEYLIIDDTPPEIVEASVAVSASVDPSGITWSFEWDSEYVLRSSIDRVVLCGPVTGGIPVTITSAEATHIHSGKNHGLIGYRTPCQPGRHEITIFMEANGQEQSVGAWKRIPVCVAVP